MDEARAELQEIGEMVKAWRLERKTRYEHCPKKFVHRARALTLKVPVMEIVRVSTLTEKQVAPFGLASIDRSLREKEKFLEIPAVKPLNQSIKVEIRDGSKLISVDLPDSINLKNLFAELLS